MSVFLLLFTFLNTVWSLLHGCFIHTITAQAAALPDGRSCQASQGTRACGRRRRGADGGGRFCIQRFELEQPQTQTLYGSGHLGTSCREQSPKVDCPIEPQLRLGRARLVLPVVLEHGGCGLDNTHSFFHRHELSHVGFSAQATPAWLTHRQLESLPGPPLHPHPPQQCSNGGGCAVSMALETHIHQNK